MAGETAEAGTVILLHEHRTLLLEATRHGVPDEVRTGVMAAISDKLGAGSQVRKLLLLLARSHKLAIVPDMTKAYRERLHAHQNVVSVAICWKRSIRFAEQTSSPSMLWRQAGMHWFCRR